jgi:antitoxin (DNA-binding transcriptional repressor) of toxin-antitoxin stability system
MKSLPKLLRAVELGDSVTICRRGVPVVDLVPTKQKAGTQRRFGTLAGRVRETDPDWWKPMSNEEADAFIDGKY